MVQDIKLKNNVKLLVGKNIINSCTYITLVFVGGYSVQKYLELAHLCEHVITTSDYKIDEKKSPNMFLGNKKADARVDSDYMMFSFCINSVEELKEKLNILSHCLNDVVINDDDLQKEEITILDELVQADMSDEYIERVKKDFNKITIKDIYEYIQNNLTADNLQIFALSNIDVENLTKISNEFINELNSIGQKNIINLNFKNLCLVNKGKEQKHAEIKLFIESKNYLQSKKDKYMFDLLMLYVNNFRYGIKQPLRHKNRLVYRTDIFTNSLDNIDLILKIKCKDENIEQVVELSKQYFDNLFKNGISEQEFSFIKQNKLDFLMSRPFHIPQSKIREFISKYIKTHNKNLDETLEIQLIDDNQEAVNNFDKKRILKIAKDIKSLKYEDFNKFLNKYFKNIDIKIEINNKNKITSNLIKIS